MNYLNNNFILPNNINSPNLSSIQSIRIIDDTQIFPSDFRNNIKKNDQPSPEIRPNTSGETFRRILNNTNPPLKKSTLILKNTPNLVNQLKSSESKNKIKPFAKTPNQTERSHIEQKNKILRNPSIDNFKGNPKILAQKPSNSPTNSVKKQPLKEKSRKATPLTLNRVTDRKMTPNKLIKKPNHINFLVAAVRKKVNKVIKIGFEALKMQSLRKKEYIQGARLLAKLLKTLMHQKMKIVMDYLKLNIVIIHELKKKDAIFYELRTLTSLQSFDKMFSIIKKRLLYFGFR